MGRSIQGFISSTTSMPTKKARNRPSWRGTQQLLGRKFVEQSETQTRELTVEEALELAILLQKNEQLAEAHELYRRVIGVVPNHPRALHYAGVLAHQQGRSSEAVALIERSLALCRNKRIGIATLA